MDKQLEQRIRERAYELWIMHGSMPDRADEYWYRAEQELLGQESGASGDTQESYPVVGGHEEAPVETSAAPLGMTSQTLDEVLTSPSAPKTRKRKSTAAAVVETAAEVSNPIGETITAPKRRRSTKTST
ncbi:DUF2934 domain-containing protein [Microvirga guangxiensis]|uniref:DUF2934 domain-containing protein n=1 Tax=Microvirga guangxiensis TaxID=549386 RepID=A0A1G5I9M9_9HYPH|nr:DUF2934 domain-containing protein [Microvirga guangxiensis]SCY72461.1 Protein of unknown function [Microvirga guangxiensis]